MIMLELSFLRASKSQSYKIKEQTLLVERVDVDGWQFGWPNLVFKEKWTLILKKCSYPIYYESHEVNDIALTHDATTILWFFE